MPKRPPGDPKIDALKELGALNPHPHAVSDTSFQESDFFDARDLVQVKYEMVRRVEIDGQPVSATAAAFGFSRPSLYQAQAALHREGLGGLLPKKRGPKGARKLNDEIVDFVTKARAEEGLGAPALARKVKERFGVKVHPRSIERALARQEKKRR